MKSGAYLAAITDESGKVIKEVYSHCPEVCDKANIFLLKRHVEMLAWMDKLDEQTEDK